MKSDNVKKGMQQAPHRSLFNALGMTEEEMNKPLVGIVSSYNEIVPGHMNLDKIVNAVKLGVAEAGGVPVVSAAGHGSAPGVSQHCGPGERLPGLHQQRAGVAAKVFGG